MSDPQTSPDLRQLLSEAIDAARPDLGARLATEPDAHLDLIALVLQSRTEVDALLRATISSARSAGCTWESIGQVLSMSRQAAQQRYGRDDAYGTEGTARAGGKVMRLAPLSAVNEMRILERAGRYGWHALAYGPLFFIVEKSDLQWEHRRLYVTSAERRRLESEGWERVGDMWFPWVYYKHRTAVPALPEPTTDDYLMRP